jgi:ubiquinone/menaquinone biosynthesis C-methylase UbiE
MIGTCTACLLLATSHLAAQTETAAKKRSPVPENINERFLDANLDAEQWLKRLEGESREIYLHHQAIVDAIGIKPGASIADVGGGTGLFIGPFAKAVTETGHVYAVDISPKLVEYMKRRIKDEGLKNVEAILSREDSTELPNDSVDFVFVCDTYHHFEYHADMLLSIRNALRRGGQLILIDFERIPGKSSDWLLGHVRAGKEQFKKEVMQSGFRFVEQVDVPGLSENYFLRFERP